MKKTLNVFLLKMIDQERQVVFMAESNGGSALPAKREAAQWSDFIKEGLKNLCGRNVTFSD